MQLLVHLHYFDLSIKNVDQMHTYSCTSYNQKYTMVEYSTLGVHTYMYVCMQLFDLSIKVLEKSTPGYDILHSMYPSLELRATHVGAT